MSPRTLEKGKRDAVQVSKTVTQWQTHTRCLYSWSLACSRPESKHVFVCKWTYSVCVCRCQCHSKRNVAINIIVNCRLSLHRPRWQPPLPMGSAASSESGLACIRFIEQALQYERRDKRVHDLRMSSPGASCLPLPGYMCGVDRGWPEE
jgi:hypothetical protein